VTSVDTWECGEKGREHGSTMPMSEVQKGSVGYCTVANCLCDRYSSVNISVSDMHSLTSSFDFKA
jgi:hypothetical protein